MLLNCNNKGCMRSNEAKLNVETNEVICTDCGMPITNLTSIMKNALKLQGQVIRKSNKKLMLACNKCKANREIVLNEEGKTVCGVCFAPIRVFSQFEAAVKEAGGLRKVDTKSKDKVDSSEETKEEEK